MKFLVTIDVEADGEWARAATPSYRNLAELERFHDLCRRHSMRPTYLVTYDVARSPEGQRALLPLANDAEIGAHLHPWTTPPETGAATDRPLPNELPAKVVREKVGRLTDGIEKHLGRRPVSHRSGRWGFDAASAAALVDLGYLADCSVTPFTSWTHESGGGAGGPDFIDAPLRPYRIDLNDVTTPGRSALVELPMTILFPRGPGASSAWARRALARRRWGLLGRTMNRLGMGPEWFRPYPRMSAGRLIAVYETACALGLPYVEMMLHSSELLPGCSPYRPTAASIEALYDVLEEVFSFAVVAGAEGATVAEFARSFLAGEDD